MLPLLESVNDHRTSTTLVYTRQVNPPYNLSGTYASSMLCGFRMLSTVIETLAILMLPGNIFLQWARLNCFF